MEKIDHLLKSEYYSRAELIGMEEEKLRKLITFAYEEVPYYRETFKKLHLVPTDFRHIDDLQKLPVLSKRDIKDPGRLTPRTPRPGTLVRRTSGSTGTPYKTIVDREGVLFETALFYRFLFCMGYEWGDRVIRLWGAPIVRAKFPVWNVVDSVRTEVSGRIWNTKRFDTYKLDRDTVSKMLSLLGEDEPQLVRGYTSSIYAISLEIIRRGMVAHVKGVTTTAEKLFDYQRKTIERAFRQKMYDQYGCMESHCLAFECERHAGLHVASEHVVMELLDDDDAPAGGQLGRVVITDLDNYAMPLIRYENGDLGKWSRDECLCGRGLPLLERIEGRIYEMLDVPGNRKIHGGFFDEVYVELGFGDRYLIDDLRVVQEDLYNYRLEFVMDGKLSDGDIKRLKEKYVHYLGDVNLQITYVKEIPGTTSGKRKFVFPCSSGAPAVPQGELG